MPLTGSESGDGVHLAVVPLDADAAAFVADDVGGEALAQRRVQEAYFTGQPWHRRDRVVQAPSGRTQQQLRRVDVLGRLKKKKRVQRFRRHEVDGDTAPT